MAQQAPAKSLPLSRHHLAKKAEMAAAPAPRLEASLPTLPTSPKLWAPTAPAELPAASEKPATTLPPQSNDASTPCSCRMIPSSPTKRLPYSRSHLAKRAQKPASQGTKLEDSAATSSPSVGLCAPTTTKPALWSAPTTTTSTGAFKPRAIYQGTPTYSGSCDFTTPNYKVRSQLPHSPPLSPCSVPSSSTVTSIADSSTSIATPSTIEYISVATPSSVGTACIATSSTSSTSANTSRSDDNYRVWPVDAPHPAPKNAYDSPALDTDGVFSRAVDAYDLSIRLAGLPLKELGKWRMEGMRF